uniref:Uncharacterized protein n=1 Tax=Knipowitschia caucasica TaxID=637954 RepID=A0AAV2JCK9_KNICA
MDKSAHYKQLTLEQVFGGSKQRGSTADSGEGGSRQPKKAAKKCAPAATAHASAQPAPGRRGRVLARRDEDESSSEEFTEPDPDSSSEWLPSGSASSRESSPDAFTRASSRTTAREDCGSRKAATPRNPAVDRTASTSSSVTASVTSASSVGVKKRKVTKSKDGSWSRDDWRPKDQDLGVTLVPHRGLVPGRDMSVRGLYLPLLSLPLLALGLGLLVPPPHDVTVRAVNTNYCLVWNWTGPEGHEVSFTTQYIGKFKLNRPNDPKWWPACDGSPLMTCDLNPLKLHYLGIYCLRVRAAVGGVFSPWRHVEFTPGEDAAVGPPSRVTVSAAGAGLEVSVLEPQTNNNTSMKEHIPFLSFRYTFWEQQPQSVLASTHTGQQPQMFHVDSDKTVVVLENLKSWTVFCVKVKSRTTNPNRTSRYSPPHCLSTNGSLHWWQVALIFLSSLCVALLLGLGLVLGGFQANRVFKQSCLYKATPPDFLKEFQVSPEPLCPDFDSELKCDLLTLTSPQETCRNSVSDDSGVDSGVDSGRVLLTTQEL